MSEHISPGPLSEENFLRFAAERSIRGAALMRSMALHDEALNTEMVVAIRRDAEETGMRYGATEDQLQRAITLTDADLNVELS